MNSAGNVIHYNRIVQRNVAYDIAKDTVEIIHKFPNITHMYMDGDVYSHALHNFCDMYPIMHRMIPEKWSIPLYSMLGLCCPEILDIIFKHMPIKSELLPNKHMSRSLLKSHIWYNVYLVGRHTLLIQLKAKSKYCLSKAAVLPLKN